MTMITRGDYFTINRPRQYGKTTIMHHLLLGMRENKKFLAIDISFEGMDSASYNTSAQFIPAFMDLLGMRLRFMGEKKAASLIEKNSHIKDFGKLSRFITSFVEEIGKKVVLMIDEVDKSCNNQLFLDFLGMLRTKYLGQNEGKDYSFHSVILAGVHDVRTIKTKLRPGEEQKYNSPWNIAMDFEVSLSLSGDEISSMLEEYSQEKNVILDIPFFAKKLVYYTSGYPFLVSYLCKIIDEKILPQKSKPQWDPEDLVTAIQKILSSNNTNFTGLIKNLENNPKLYDFVSKIILNGMDFTYNRHNSLIDLGTIYGVLKEEKGRTRLHNRLYEQLIYNYMSSNIETADGITLYHVSDDYTLKDGTLDIEKVIAKFQQFMKEQYSTKDTQFIERNGRLLFLAFLKPIINGKGFDFKEVQISEEKRLDVVITMGAAKYIIELKIWRGAQYHQKGIRQLCDYLDNQGQNRGYLLIFDLRKEIGQTGQSDKQIIRGKEISTAWV